MKKKFTFLMAAFMLLMMILPGQAVGQTFKRISSSSTLSDGDQIIFVNQAETYACGTQQNTNNRTPVEISVSDHTYSYVSTDNVQVFTVKKNAQNEFGFHTGSGYIYSASNSKNNLQTNTTPVSTAPSGTSAWSLSASDFVFSCSNVTNTSYYLAFNGTSYFSQYKSGQSKPYIYERAYTVTYNAGGGTGTMTDTDSPYTSGETVSLMDNTFTRDDYEFSGWQVKDELDNEITVTDGDFTMPRANVTVTAQWTPATTDPYFDVDDVDLVATATTGTIEYKVENSVTGGKISASCLAGGSWISDVTVTDEDSDDNTITFTTSVNAEAERIGTIRITYTYDSDKTKTADVTITQAIAQYTVTYQANGGTGGPVVKTYNYGTNVIVLAYNDEAIGFTAPSGKSFKNWKENSNTYNAGATISSINANHTLAAQWEDIPKFYLVTNTNQIVAGKHYVIVSSKEEGSAYGIGAPNGTYRDRAEVTISKDSENKLYVLKTESLCDFVLSGADTDNKWTIYDKNNSVYLYGGSKGTLGGNSGSPTIPNTAKWSVGITEDGDVEFNNNDFYIEHNSSASRFASYAGTQGDVYLFVKDNDIDLEIYSPTTIASGKTVDCDTYTIGNSNASLTIADGGQLVHSNTGVQATVKKHINAYTANNNGWNFIASPMTSLAINTPAQTNLIGGTAKYDLYTFDQSEDDVWQNYKQSHFTTLDNGTGYLYAREEDIDIEFVGELANPASGVFDLVFDKNVTGNKQGVNLVGNPYPCNATVSGSCYVINGNIVESVTGSVTIAPCTGVIVKASDEGQTVTFTKAPNTPAMSHANNNAIELTLTQAVANTNTRGESVQTLDNAIVSFNEGSELPKFYFGTQNANIYIPLDNEEYAIVSSNAQGEMPVNFRAYVAGEYTITVNPENVEMGYLHLIDNIAGTDIDLLATPSYTFNAKADDYESRFRLVFSANSENESGNENDNFAFISDGQLIVTGEGTLQVIDMMGRVISSEMVNGTTSKTIDAKAGVYVLRLINGTDVKTQKMVIR